MVIGILSNGYYTLPVYYFYSFLALSYLFSSVKIYRNLTDSCILLTIFCCGQFISLTPDFHPDESKTYLLKSRCEEQLPHNNYILSSQGQKFYLSNFYTNDKKFSPGDSLCFFTKIQHLPDNTNPGEFSYTHYLEQQNIFFRLIPVSNLKKTGHSHTIYSFFYDVRESLLAKTDILVKDSVSRALINALCLGYRNDLDSELQDLFISTGTIHLLSVSGLHTGAIYLMIIFIFKSIGLTNRKTELAVIPLLWGYACLTGLSPSAIRAATILSFITIGKAFCRTNTPLNSIAASAFFSLLICPYFLYSLSFLMSYSAYTGILTIYPLLFRLPGKLSPVISKIYACVCITISAQLLTIPISAYYFHTININGFLANIIAIPISTILLYSATTCLLLPLIISIYIAPLIEWISKLLIHFLRIFEPISFNLKELYPNPITIILLYLCLAFIYLFLTHKKRIWQILSTTSITLLLLWSITVNLHLSSKQEIIVFQLQHQTIVLLNYNGYYSFLKNTSPTSQKIKPYIRQNKLTPLPPHAGLLHGSLLESNYHLSSENNNILITAPSHAAYKYCKTLIVTENLHPEQMYSDTTNLLPSLIIIDGSNNKLTAKKWKIFCKQNHITYFSTYESGYIRLFLK